METDRVQAVLRQRQGFEAVDLGFRLARSFWRPIAGSWAVLVLPVGLGIVLALRNHPLWATALLWWLRPLFDRVPLFVLSRAFFSETPGLGETLRAVPALLRSGLGTSLFLQRLSPARTFLLPVLQLEGLRGAARRERCRALSRRELGTAAGLQLAGAHFNGILILGLLGAVQLFVPDEIAWDVTELVVPFLGDTADDPGQMIVPLLYLLGTSIVEPLLVAGGFALYLNRRIYLEGWDIDLAFRNLARRHEGAGSAAGRRAAAAVLLAGVALSAEARGAPACVPEDLESASSCIAEVLAGPDFGTTREVELWLPRELEGGLDFAPFAWVPNLLAQGFEAGAWLVLALALIAGAVVLARSFGGTAEPGSPQTSAPSLFGLDLDPTSLPDDVVAVARACWAAGDRIAALSLLYRGALVFLTDRRSLEIPASATEGDCVRLVGRMNERELVHSFSSLTEAWMGARYARRPPGTETFEALCRSWGAILESAP